MIDRFLLQNFFFVHKEHSSGIIERRYNFKAILCHKIFVLQIIMRRLIIYVLIRKSEY